MSNETLYPNGSAPRLVGENGRETCSTGAPEGERATPVVAARGVAELCTCKAADDMHIHAEDFGQLEPGALVCVPAEPNWEVMYAELAQTTTQDLTGKVATLEKQNASLRSQLASVQWERDEARAELAEVDRVLGNRSAFDDCEGREEKIAFAIREAAEAERLRAEVKRLKAVSP